MEREPTQQGRMCANDAAQRGYLSKYKNRSYNLISKSKQANYKMGRSSE